MTLTQGDVIAIIIALLGCLTVMGIFWRQNIALQKENIELRRRLFQFKSDGV
jgi:hypothetical protein